MIRASADWNIQPTHSFKVKHNNLSCFYIKSSQRILSWDRNLNKAVLLDKDLNVTHTSEFSSRFQLAAIEFEKTTLFGMHSVADQKFYLVLIDSTNLKLIS